MGLQHAIHDVREDSHAEAGEFSRTGIAAGISKLSPSLGRLVAGAGSLARRSRGGRTSIWRVVALAILVYVGALNLANFLVVRPVRARLDGIVEEKAIVEDFLLLRQSGQALAGVRDALMRGDERVTVLGDVRQMAADAGLTVVGEPKLLSSQEASKKMTEYPMEITLRGSYHETGEFIRSVESSSRLLSVKSIEIDAGESSAANATVTVTLGALSWED